MISPSGLKRGSVVHVDMDETVNAVIITGPGQYFSAGGDFKMVQGGIDDFETRTHFWRRIATGRARASARRFGSR